jgi:hypothetical protein
VVIAQELFQIGKDKTGSFTYDTVYIKDTNNVAISSGDVSNKCITIIDIESQEVMTTMLDILLWMISLTDLSLRFNILSPFSFVQ